MSDGLRARGRSVRALLLHAVGWGWPAPQVWTVRVEISPYYPRVTDESGCDELDGGWYYDENAERTLVILCPTTCSYLEGSPETTWAARTGCSGPVVICD
jgi:hypothetical protein